MSELLLDDRNALPRMAPSALEIFVVLKKVFRHLTMEELLLARLVNRRWNFAAVSVSELVSRNYQPPAVKICSSSSNRVRDQDYNLYIDFENNRRRMWTEVYGSDFSVIEFRHLHFSYPDESAEFRGILRSPWLESVSSLTLSTLESTTDDLLGHWLLPSFPNLERLTCTVQPDFITGNIFSGTVYTYPTNSSDSGASMTNFEPLSFSEKSQPFIRSKLHTVSVTLEEACAFPWHLLSSFPQLKNMNLHFGDAAALIKCAENLEPKSSLFGIQNLRIGLIHKPDLQDLLEDVKLSTKSFAIANAKLCNHFPPEKSITISTILPAAFSLVFLKALNMSTATDLELEIAAPCTEQAGTRIEFVRFLVHAIGSKFRSLKSLHLHYLQYKQETRFHFLEREYFHHVPNRLQRLEQLHIICSPTTDSGHETYITVPLYADHTIRSQAFQELTELVYEVSTWFDCLAVVDLLTYYEVSVKKLVLQGSSSYDFDAEHPRITSWCFFPEMSPFPKYWTYGVPTSRPYHGIPGLKTLELLRVKNICVSYDERVEAESRKIPALKAIILDSQFNKVDPELPAAAVSRSEIWPSVVGSVTITCV